VYAARVAVVDGSARHSYREFAARCAGLAVGLADVGLRPGDRAAVLALNSHRALECYYGVPLAHATLVPLNTRLTVDDYRYILAHAGVRVLLVDPALADVGRALAGVVDDRVVVLAGDRVAGTHWTTVERVIASAGPAALADMLDRVDELDEDAPITINYTSGTTARPKGVVLTHRLTALNALDVVVHARLTLDDVYLHTLPMFHVNGWGGVWAITAVGATHVCLPKVDPAAIVELIDAHGVTVACAAPTVLVLLGSDPSTAGWRPRQAVRWYVGGAPPPSALIRRMEDELGFNIVHVYGLTETGPWLTVCEWRREWDARSREERAVLKARQGVGQLLAGRVRVVHADLTDVAPDGVDVGEIVVRGPTTTPGYYADPEATRRAWAGGWFHTGDLAVLHPDGYLQIVDREKDLIVSGGENVSSVEVEGVLYQHPEVLEAAVVAAPHAVWGETVKAVVVRRPGAAVTADELIAFARGRLAHFKAPRLVEFVDALPKTATGKIQKYVLRAAAREKSSQHPI